MHKYLYRIIAGTITLAAVIVFGTTLVHAVWYAPDPEVAPPSGMPHMQPSVPAMYPSRLEIPALGIDTRVQQVGINARGNMGTPSNFTDVAWYKYGTVPGHVGSAVIDGHVDNGLGLSGVFKHLSDLKAGDDIYVTDRTGEKLHFVVDNMQTYPYDAAPNDVIFGRTDAARLNLITCSGSWVRQDKTYNQRLVVFATLVS